ncbi:hypothetical protein [Coralloluteibacterium thermophilus]|uniref:Bulb-type lectin domain-containing protein n=1 Tax=Coralloluteibacterium thermophilum TaxID=2707049 RepID=A0ABV9NNU2_9GAMM
MPTRFLNPAPVFLDLLGLGPVIGGSLAFYERGTTSPKTTWSDPGLFTPNPNPVPLDSSGRSNNEIWLDGEYSVVLRDSLGATIWTRDVVPESAAGGTIPSLLPGQFLTNDGSNLLWQPVRQVPDPSGSANRLLSTDGANLIWVPPPDIPQPPDPDVTEGSGFLQVLDTLQQWGTATIPASGDTNASMQISFPTGYAATPYIGVTVNTQTPTNSGHFVIPAVVSQSPTGFTVIVAASEFQSSTRIQSAVPVSWYAIGKKAAS